MPTVDVLLRIADKSVTLYLQHNILVSRSDMMVRTLWNGRIQLAHEEKQLKWRTLPEVRCARRTRRKGENANGGESTACESFVAAVWE